MTWYDNEREANRKIFQFKLADYVRRSEETLSVPSKTHVP